MPIPKSIDIVIYHLQNKSKKTLYQLTEEECATKKFLGRACGLNLQHCVSLGIRDRENFANDVQWYCERMWAHDLEDKEKEYLENQPEAIIVEFYAEKEDSKYKN